MDIRFLDALRIFGGAIRKLGPAISAIIFGHLATAKHPDAVLGGPTGPGLRDLGIDAARDAIEAVVRAARAEVDLRGHEFAQKSLALCFQDHALPIFADVANQARSSTPALAAAEAHQATNPPASKGAKRTGRKAA